MIKKGGIKRVSEILDELNTINKSLESVVKVNATSVFSVAFKEKTLSDVYGIDLSVNRYEIKMSKDCMRKALEIQKNELLTELKTLGVEVEND